MKKSTKWAFIVNPIAGSGFAGTYTEVIQKKLDEYNVNGEIILTLRKGHATELANRLAGEDFTHVIAVGGDGTMNEIINGLPQNNDIITGIITAGTGNDFACVLGFSEHFTDKEWRLFFESNVIKIDVGKCNDHLFLNGMGLGFDAQVAFENYDEDMNVKEGADSKYLWHIIKNLFLYKEKLFKAQANGETHESMTFMKTISIGRRFAGKYFITPEAIANDGLLDICHVEPLNLLERFRIFSLVPTGAHLKESKVNYYKTDDINIQFNEKVPHHLDGELFYADKFHVTVLPQCQSIIYNPEGNHFFNI